MKNGLKMALAFGFGIALLQVNAAAQDKGSSKLVSMNSSTTNAPPLSPKEQKEHISYAIGMNIGTNIKRGGVDLDIDVISGAIKDVMSGRDLKLTEQQAQEAMRSYQVEARAKQGEMQKQAAEKNKKEGEEFLAANKKKEGVKIHPVTLPDGTVAELQCDGVDFHSL